MMLEEMTWVEIVEGLSRTRTVILPMGATEEHGPHLPTFTDTIQAEEVAKEVARRREVFVAPSMPYGVCMSTKAFPGTISIGEASLRLISKDILVSLHWTGFRNVLILTGHAGSQHMASLREAASKALDLVDLRISLVSDFELVRSIAETPGDGHAGEIETSRMLLHREELVKGLPEGQFPERPKHLILKDMRPLMGSGIIGDPTKATREKGEAFFQAAVEGVIEAIEELESYPAP